MWAAGLVLLAAWMPFNNGLRPEGQIATGALITYVLIERAIISGRLTPAALAIITAAFTLGIQPTGLIAVAALLAGGRPILRILVRRRRHRRHLAAGAAAAGRGHRHPDRGVRRPDAGNGVGGHQDSHRDRPEPGVVHREPALLLPDPADGGRLAVAAVRLPDHRAVPVRLDVHHVAAQAGSRRGPRAGVAADGRHLRHHVLPDVHPHQVGAPLRACSPRWAPRWRRWPRCWCRRRCCAGRATGWRSWRRCCSCWRCASPPPTAGGTCRATACRSTTRCRRSAESPSAQSSSRCSPSPRSMRSGCISRRATTARAASRGR